MLILFEKFSLGIYLSELIYFSFQLSKLEKTSTFYTVQKMV